MADTVYKLTHTGEQIDSAIDNAVRSDAQILTSEQQTQARTNIGAASAASAASAADLTTETNKRITADTGVRGLTATVEATSTASQAYAIGAYFVYNGLLYKCTVAIAKGGTITPGTNCTATTAGAEISTLNQNLALKTGFYYSTTAKSGVSIHYQSVSLPFLTTEQTAHITFEAPFTSACWAVFVQMISGYTTTNPHISITNKTTTGCDFVYSANTAFTVVVDFIAIGY